MYTPKYTPILELSHLRPHWSTLHDDWTAIPTTALENTGDGNKQTAIITAKDNQTGSNNYE
jgi:hypothetical protein